jgi:hypothetical protein
MIPNPVYDARMTRLWVDSTLLMADAATVLMLRTLTMMGGGRSAFREGERMLAEKIEAGFELAGAVASGRIRSPQGAARKAVSVYGKRVRANRKRLG